MSCQPQDAQRRQHQNPDPRAEIPAVNPHAQLEQDRARQPLRGVPGSGIGRLQFALHRFLRHEQQGGEQNQVRHQLVEHRRRRPTQQERPRDSAHQARHNQHPESRFGLAQFPPVAPSAAHRSRPDRHRAGGVRRHRIQSQPDQRRKRDQRAAARDRVDRAGQKRRAERHRRLCEVQVCNSNPLAPGPGICPRIATTRS